MKQKGLAPILIVLLIATAISGYLIYQNQSAKPTSPVTTVASPAPTAAAETANPDSIGANWKTYTASDFSFKYPSSGDWTIAKGDGSPSKGYVVRVYCWQCEAGHTLNGFSVYRIAYTNNSDYLVSTQGVVDHQDFYFNGFKGVEVLSPPNQGIGLVQYFTVNKGQGYILMNEAYSSPSNKIKDLPVPNPNILSTFKFQ